jgi:hypothetical protein
MYRKVTGVSCWIAWPIFEWNAWKEGLRGFEQALFRSAENDSECRLELPALCHE